MFRRFSTSPTATSFCSRLLRPAISSRLSSSSFITVVQQNTYYFHHRHQSTVLSPVKEIQSQIESVESSITTARQKLYELTMVKDNKNSSGAHQPAGILTSRNHKMKEFDQVMAVLDRDILSHHHQHQKDVDNTNSNKNNSDDDDDALIDQLLDKNFPLASVIGTWIESDLFQNPNRELLAQNPVLLCRWLIVSSHLMIGEDHVDWACETIARVCKNSKEIRSQIGPRLAIRTIRAFETWYVKESPQCFGLVPLIKVITEEIEDSHSRDKVSAEDVAGIISTIITLFRKRQKGDRPVPIPRELDEAVAGVVKAIGESYLFDFNPKNFSLQQQRRDLFDDEKNKNNHASSLDRYKRYVRKRNQNFDEWLAVIVRFFQVGVRRLPVTLRMIFDSLFFTVKEHPLAQGDKILFHQWPVFVENRLKQPAQGSSTAASSLTRQLIDAMDVIINEEVPNSATNNNSYNRYWELLFIKPLYGMVREQLALWPLRDINLISSLCARFINQQNEETNNCCANRTGGSEVAVIESAKTLLLASIRCSHDGFRTLIENEKKAVAVNSSSTGNQNRNSSSSHHHHGKRKDGQDLKLPTVESALCANIFLELTNNSIPKEILTMASCGLKDDLYSQKQHQHTSAVAAIEKRGNMIDNLEAPAQLVSARFPHLRK